MCLRVQCVRTDIWSFMSTICQEVPPSWQCECAVHVKHIRDALNFIHQNLWHMMWLHTAYTPTVSSSNLVSCPHLRQPVEEWMGSRQSSQSTCLKLDCPWCLRFLLNLGCSQTPTASSVKQSTLPVTLASNYLSFTFYLPLCPIAVVCYHWLFHLV
jgi:hypothetical protein